MLIWVYIDRNANDLKYYRFKFKFNYLFLQVFESVIKWVKQDMDQRKDFLTELMEHVRLPLIASRPGIFLNIVNEPLLKNNPKCLLFS